MSIFESFTPDQLDDLCYSDEYVDFIMDNCHGNDNSRRP